MAGINFKCLCFGFLVILCSAELAYAQEQSCSAVGAVVTAVIVTAIVTLVVAYVVYLWYKKRKRKQGKHLILETDPEKGKEEYAFDNPGFKDAGLTPIGKALEKNGKHESGTGKPKWTHWSPLGVLGAKSEKKKTLDDTALDEGEIKVVSLRSHDFTGLGFNICGNMRDGIFIKDVLHRGPAFESGKLSSGDRINSVTISFEHMVYEDALTILSYASPYEVIIEAKGGKIIHTPGQSAQPGHPIYRSSSSTDLMNIEKSAKKRLFQSEDLNDSTSTYSSLQKSRSNATTLERSNSPAQIFHKQERVKKAPPKPQVNPDHLKQQLEQRISEDHKQQLQIKNEQNLETPLKIESETQKTESKYQKFGVKVFPEQKSQISPKIADAQNDNNINLERHQDTTIQIINETKLSSEVEKPKIPPEVKKREKIPKVSERAIDVEKQPEAFERNHDLNGSGIKRDKDGIPQEIPSHMLNAAVAARRNRKGEEPVPQDESDGVKSPKKLKGKAPAPPEEKTSTPMRKSLDEVKFNFSSNLDEIHSVEEPEIPKKKNEPIKNNALDKEPEEIIIVKDPIKDYNSDSDMEVDNQSSVNTIELNASDITIHQVEDDTEELQNRKTASTGDLTKIQKGRKTSTGTLERAQSLDITDTGMPTLSKKRKGGKIEDVFDFQNSDEDMFGKALINKEPRLSLVLDGLNTFQRNRLKKSTEWGNLEDAILNYNKDDSFNSLDKINGNESDESLPLPAIRKFDFGAKSPEFDALVNKINEIKKETPQLSDDVKTEAAQPFDQIELDPTLLPKEIEITTSDVELDIQVRPVKKKNEIWPTDIFTQVNGREEGLSSIEKPIEIDTEDEGIQDFVIPEKTTVPEPREQNMSDDVLIKPRLLKSHLQDVDKEDDLKLTQQPTEKPVAKVVSAIPSVDKKSSTENLAPKSAPVVNIPKVNMVQASANFLDIERAACFKDDIYKLDDTNVSDDIKVSRHSLGSLERSKIPITEDTSKSKSNISNVTISNTTIDLIKTPSEDVPVNINITKTNLNESVIPNEHQVTKETTVTITSAKPRNGAISSTNISPVSSNETKYSSKTTFSGNDDETDIKTNVTSTFTTVNLKTPNRQENSIVNDNISSGIIEITNNDNGELYSTTLEDTKQDDDKDNKRFEKLIVTTPDLIKNVTIAEAIHNLNNEVTIEGPSSLTLEIPLMNTENLNNNTHDSFEQRVNTTNGTINVSDSIKTNNKVNDSPPEKVEISSRKFNISQIPRTTTNIPKMLSKSPDGGKPNSSLTYITEIQVVTPNNDNNTNVSEIEIVPKAEGNKNRNLDREFETYVKNFESNIRNFETNIKNFETNVQDNTSKTNINPPSPTNDKNDAEKELHKIQEIAEEQLKKLPEMRFTTSSYEASRIPEKRQSQIEMLRSNFEKNISDKSPPKSSKVDVQTTKSRIPIATTAKTPPMSPERRDSKNFDPDAQKDIIEMMTNSIHSSNLKYTPKTSNKNVTVTSIRSNSKIPSGLPTYGSRPPIPPRKSESFEGDTTIQISTSNGGSESIRQWVFNQNDNNSVTNIVVDNKSEK